MVPDIGLKANERDIEAVGDESEHGEDGGEIQAARGQPNLLKAEHGDGDHEGQRQFEPEKIGFIAGRDDLFEQAAVEEILETEEGVDPESHQQGSAEGDQNRKFQMTAEGSCTLGRLEDSHG